MIDVAVIGGGLSGLAAAVSLSGRGFSAALVEGRPYLGGRARSFTDAASGAVLDNGQHLMMGCYTSTLQFLELIGSSGTLRRVDRMSIPFRDTRGGKAVLRTGSLPHPFGMAQAFLGYNFLGVRDKAGVLRVAAVLRKTDPARLDGITAAEWLRDLGQGAHAMSAFWEPVILATLNARPAHSSAALLARVLREVFLSNTDASALLFCTGGLSGTFADPAAAFLDAHAARVFTHTRVEMLRRDASGWTLIFADGRQMESKSIVLAMPPWDTRALLERSALGSAAATLCPAFVPSPIVSVYIWSRERLSAEPIIGLLDTVVQWVFDKGRAPDGHWLSTCTVSAADTLCDDDTVQWESRVRRDIAAVFGQTAARAVHRMLVIRERAATFRPSPGLESLRPSALTEETGLFLAGDWVGTGLPATIESAVRGGFFAADAVAAHFVGTRGGV